MSLRWPDAIGRFKRKRPAAPAAPEPIEPVRTADPIPVQVTPDASLLAVYRRRGWTIYRDRETGALLGAVKLDHAGRIRLENGEVHAEFEIGDYRVQPFEPGALPVIIPAAIGDDRLEVYEG